LITALLRGGETENVICSEARDSLKRLPSDVYWAGLLALGIRTQPGSRAEMLAAGDVQSLWSPGLPGAADDLLDKATFRLTPEEGSFLRDRLAVSARDTLFNELAQAGDRAEAAAIWLHPMRATWSGRNISIVDQAERFTRVMNGAALLYNLMLAERAAAMQRADAGRWHDLAAEYRVAWVLGRPRPPKTLPQAGAWPGFAQTIHRVAPQTLAFVTDWAARVLSGQPVADDAAARALFLRCDSRLKGPKARLTNDAALARWGGVSGAAVLAYRWPVVQRHLQDLADAV
jgi:hypothetical protein